MRFVAFSVRARSGIAVETVNGELRGLFETDANYPGTIFDLLTGGREEMAVAARMLSEAKILDRERIVFRPPIPLPPKIVCVGLNYADHTKESSYEQPKYPAFFSRFNSTLVGHEVPIVRPRVSEQLDYEGELVAVIGKAGRHIPPKRAEDHVAGYSIFNDASVRDYQFRSPQWTVGKNFDATGAFGPAFVTCDELPSGARGLKLQTMLNGRVVQEATTADMIFDIATLVSLISEVMTLQVGDIVVSGTPSGVGFARKPPLFMQSGDVCEVAIEGVGTLRNRIVDEDEK